MTRALALLLLLFAHFAVAEEMGAAAKAHFDKGIQLYQSGRYDEAIAELEAGRAVEPRPEFLYSLGQSERKRGDCARANDYFRRYRAEVLARGLLDKVGPAEKLIDLCTQEQRKRAREASEAGDHATAARQWEGLLAQPGELPRDALVEAWAYVGTDWFRLGRADDAARAFAELHKLDSARAPAGACDEACRAAFDRAINPPVEKPIEKPIEPPAAQAIAKQAPVEKTPARVVYGPARLHVDAAAVGDFVSLQAGAEVGASVSPGAYVDLGAAASIGRSVGGRLCVGLHPSRVGGGRFRWYVQLRGVVHPVDGGVALGGGAGGGGTVELGPGRLLAGVIGEAYVAPAGYFPFAVLGVVGYQLDLLKPARVVH